ncbi:MAG: alkaline phosphatase family protein [bacterium]
MINSSFKFRKLILGLILLNFVSLPIFGKPPKLTVVLVIDQFGYQYIQKLQNNFNYSFNFLLNNGIIYTNAHHPHGAPTTGTGHAAIGTGCYAKDHGIVLNSWVTPEGKKTNCYDDASKDSAVFGENKLCDYGISAKRMMVDSLADQFIHASKPDYPNKSFSLSFKPRSAIGMGGHLSKNIWFDEETGLFTSSKAFFDKLPEWVNRFNKKKNISKIKEISWKLCYPRKSKYYKFKNIDINEKTDYKFAGYKKSLISPPGKMTPNDPKEFEKNSYESNPYEIFQRTPLANETLLELSKECLKNNFNTEKNETFLLWVSLSPLDPLGHIYGPQSLEITDMIYHLDKQIKDFFKLAQKLAGKKELFFVLTADHGLEEIPEIMQIDGYKKAVRINVKTLIKEMNDLINNKYEISDLVLDFRTSMFYLDQQKFKKLKKEQRHEILNDLKIFLKKQNGVKNIWTYNELKNSTFEPYQLENFYKMQLYPERSGQLICQPQPYSVFTPYPTGTSHRCAYNFDTNVPLFLYQKGKYEKKYINEKVWVPQLPVTLARILEIAKPSASPFEPLPGIKFDTAESNFFQWIN